MRKRLKNQRSGNSILDQLIEAGLELYGLYVMDESQLANLRRLTDRHRTIYQKPDGDPEYGQIVDLETLEGILNIWREIAQECRDSDSIKYNLDSHLIGLIHNGCSARLDKEALLKHAIDHPGIAKWADNFNEWFELEGAVRMKMLLLTSRAHEV